MTPLPHVYEVRLQGGPSGYGDVTANGLPLLTTAPPPEFNGPGDAWSPEHLLLAAVESCFLFTLRAVARAAKIEFTRLEVETAGTVDRQGGVTRFIEIVLRPTISVETGSSRDRVLDALAKTERACLISASLSTPIRVEPTLFEESRHVA
jgi:peroxiredoxin-like protein